MKLKRTLAVVTAFCILSICFLIYYTLDGEYTKSSVSIQQEYKDNQWLHFEDRLKELEKKVEAAHLIKAQDYEESNAIPHNPIQEAVPEIKSKPFMTKNVTEIMYDQQCSIQLDIVPRTDVQMLELYKDMAFDNPDGGVWKQGWKIEVSDEMWNKHHKLKVFVVPHSHNDPGWIRTLEEYYLGQTKHILSNMVEKLPEDPRRKFIWAEISYFSMWWDEASKAQKEIIRKLIKNNQLEFVTGGWVMNDEANAHWLSIIHQLTEGHQWLQKNLNYTPISHWAIDPFGYSATQADILKRSGFHNMLIQRTHYSVKKQLAHDQNLEFLWKQAWDKSTSNALFTHMMPFYSYDIPHTCGPDPKICCQFDFKRLPGHGMTCPWRVPPSPITDTNVAEKAYYLLDQYRKKSRLYKTNVLLVPLGDDFRYDHSTEWDVQYKNYQLLFDHMNSNPSLNVNAQFGTLSDYFKALEAEKKKETFPSLSGDFFTYADRDDHYWSGYYTSRPFYKRVERVLLYYVRAAEIILTLAHISGKPGARWIADVNSGLEKQLGDSRRSLALFQHHDGITGTAKDHVMIDYGNKMLDAILSCQNVIQLSTNLLLNGPETQSSDVLFYYIDDVRQGQQLPDQHTITIGPELSTKRVVVYNSLPTRRQELVTFIVNTPFVEVLDGNHKRVQAQVSPTFEHLYSISSSKYRLSFVADVEPLSLVGYVVNALSKSELHDDTVASKGTVYNLNADLPPVPDIFEIETYNGPSEFSIKNSRMTASFNSVGLLKAIRIGSKTHPVHLDFAKYGVRPSKETSGAYLFLPDGDAVPISITDTIVKVLEGPLYSQVDVQLPYVRHIVTLYNTPGADSLGLEIQNIVDIAKTSNYELVMRFSTAINSGEEFFTDLNGYQMLRRKRFKKLPLQANYYPMPSTAFIEDKDVRLTVVSASPLGVASLDSGKIEIMQDRRLMQDDNRGLGQGVMDNHPTRHVFRVLLEDRRKGCKATAHNHPSGFPSLAAQTALDSLLYPLTRLIRTSDEDETSAYSYRTSSRDPGQDFFLASLRTGVQVNDKQYVGLLLQRRYLETCFADQRLLETFKLSDGTVTISEILPNSISNLKMNEASLTFLHLGNLVDVQKALTVCPMETRAFVLHR